jgi:PAS domain S-box-containing protein
MPKKSTSRTQKQLAAENEDLRARLDEAEDTLRAIRNGEVDALIVSGVDGEQVFTLTGADRIYQLLIEDMSEGALTLTAEGVILYANRCFAEMLKTPLEKVIGSAIHTWIAPDSQQILQSLLRKGIDEKRREQLELTAGDGRMVPVCLSVSNLPIKEMPDSFCLVATNLTEQKRSDAIVASEKLAQELLAASTQSRLELLSVIESQKQAEEALRKSEVNYRILIESLQEGIWVIDKDNMTTFVNIPMADMLGYTVEEMLGKSLFSFMDERGVNIANQRLERRRQGIQEQHEFEFIKKDRTRIYVLIETTPLTDDDGNYRGAIAGMVNITERKRMEEELLKVEKLESVGLLAGGLAHDFNNILTIIMGNISLAKTDLARGDDPSELLTEAERASKRAQTLTRQLLTFAKGGAPVKETASIKDILKESCSFVLRGSKSRCEFSLREDLFPGEVDVGQISQVINNIVINANQAMPKGGIIQVAAENLIIDNGHGLPLKPGRYIRISIKDQGTGIAEKHLSNIFDPYFTTKQEGSGLGLATTYSIVKKHDGYITVESKLGEGTTFHIYLPASEKAVPEKEEIKLIKGQGRILVMDDEVALKKMIGRMLRKLGYESEFAKDGAEAIRMYKAAKKSEKSYDAVILDLTIPGGMGGKDTVKKLLEIDPEVKAIVSSGYSDDPVLANFQEYGFKGMMPKPFETLSLSKVLHEVLEGKGKD